MGSVGIEFETMKRHPALLALIALAALPSCDMLDGPAAGDLLTFEVREVDWDPPTPRIVLFVSDDKVYPCINYHIDNELRIRDHSIRVEMSGGVTEPGVCLTAIGPAQIRAPLAIAEGSYMLEFVRRGVTDRYTLNVTEAAIQIAVVDAHYTSPTALSFPRAP